MAKRKYFLTVRYKTKEEFDKSIDDIYNDGYEQGFQDGRINALSYILNSLGKDFSEQERSTAQWEVRNRLIQNWRKEAERKRKEAEEFNQLYKDAIKEAESVVNE